MRRNETLKRVEDFCASRGLDYNDYLMADIRSGKIPEDAIPTSPISLSILISCYMVFCPSKKLALISNQSAKVIQILRNKGFQLAKNEGPNHLVSEDGVLGRKILGFKWPERPGAALICLSTKKRREYIKDRCDPFTGMKSDMEIDHRQPVEASYRLREAYPMLDETLVESGKDRLYYAVLSKSSNTAKRGACKHCLQGEEIRLPEWAVEIEKYSGERYKRRFTDNLEHNLATGAPGCAGCAFFDSTLRMGQDFFNR